MEMMISRLLGQFERGALTRRQLIQGLALAAAGPGAAGAAVAQTRGLHTMHLDHINYVVADYARTRDFYASLMGMAVANDNGRESCELHFGDAHGVGVRDRAMISLHQAQQAAPARIGIDHIALRVADWNTGRVQAELERRGLRPRLQLGGALDTPNYASLMVQDPDGLGVQISGIAAPGSSASGR